MTESSLFFSKRKNIEVEFFTLRNKAYVQGLVLDFAIQNLELEGKITLHGKKKIGGRRFPRQRDSNNSMKETWRGK